MQTVSKILMPNKPHLDPIAALYLLAHYGQEQYPGIENAKINYWEFGEDINESKIAELKDAGVLILDIGGGDFDHHSKENETTTSLVAQKLGIEKNPELSALLAYIQEDDLEGLHNRYGELAQLVKNLYKQNYSNDETINYALHFIDIFQKSQLDFFIHTKNEFTEKNQTHRIKRNNQNLKIGIINSDNPSIANYGITQENFSLIIQQRSTGHIFLLTNKHHNINLKEIVAAIRLRELELSGYNKHLDPKHLQFEGKSNLVPNWFYHRSLNSFLNGSNALSETKPTKVPLEEVILFATYGITTDISELCDCDSGGNSCPYRKYGFSKCK